MLCDSYYLLFLQYDVYYLLFLQYDGYTSCPLTVKRNEVILAEFGYDLRILETIPIDQSKPRYIMSLLKTHLLPALYWRMVVK